MDPRLLSYYNSELQHLREIGGEFADEFPKIASRLGLDSFECVDPYVERLLEGFAFVAARIQLKIDAEFPKFTQHLLQMIYPHYLAPTPSMAVVQFTPDLSEGSLAEGFTIPRHSALRSEIPQGEQTACEYRTAHDVTLWPIKIVEAEYFNRELVSFDIPKIPGVRAGIRMKLESTAGLNFNELALDQLTFYIRGSGEQPMHIYEQVLANSVAAVVRPGTNKPEWQHILEPSSIRRKGFDDSDAMLPYGNRSFHGYRMLEEYFTLPQRYLFFDLKELEPAVQRCEGNSLELIFLFDRIDRFLENQVDDADFALFASPAINLFEKRSDRIHLSETKSDYHVIPDRTRPVDFEVYDVTSATGYASGTENETPFLPFYACHDATSIDDTQAYFVINRRQRKIGSRRKTKGPRSSYVGSETFLSLVDRSENPYRSELRQLGLSTLCTNRDLPLYMPIGIGNSDFSVQTNAPVESVICLAGPTKPKPSRSEMGGETSWRLISHLSLNYLSLLDTDEYHGAAALRSMLRLYGDTSEPAIRKQIDGIRSIGAEPITRPIQSDGPVAFGRGLEVLVTMDEAAFEGTGVFLLGAVLEEFFAKYVSLNSFTETVIATLERGEIMRWPARIGRRQIL